MLRPERSIETLSSPDPHHYMKKSVNESTDDYDHMSSPVKYPETSIPSSPANYTHHRHGAHLHMNDSLLPRAVTQHQSNSVGQVTQQRPVITA
jgi:hypothetical protein